MDTIDDRRAVIQPLSKFWYQNKVAAMDMLRLDLLHPVVSGNKWYKLRLNVDFAKEKGFTTILTFGGGFSNHLVATAYTAKLFGLKAIGIVRGKYAQLTPTLLDCQAYGMELIFVTKEDYKNKEEPEWQETLVNNFDQTYIIPEGGANQKGIEGAGLIRWKISNTYSHIITAVGSGTTMIGLRNKLPEIQTVFGFAPFKEGVYLKETISRQLDPGKNQNWDLFDQWHFGGFGKWDNTLLRFMNEFYDMNKIPLDIVYTSKMMFGMQEMLLDNFFTVGDKILCIHSGGVQGNVSVRDKLIF